MPQPTAAPTGCARGSTTTIAGSGSRGSADGTGTVASFDFPRGVACSPDGTMLAVADSYSHRIRLVAMGTGAVTTLAGSGTESFADGTGAAAAFRYPYGVSYSPDGAT
eukprot:gene17875-biopygen31090